MEQRRKTGSGYSYNHFDKIYATHWLKFGIDQRKEKEGVVIPSNFDMHIYVTYQLKLGTDQ